MPFRPAGSNTFKGRIHDESGKRYIVTLSTTDEATAAKVEAYGKQLRADRRWDVLQAILDDKFTLAEAYDHRSDIAAFLTDETTPDLWELIEQWKPHVAGTKYYRQARAVLRRSAKVKPPIPGKRYPVSEFRIGRLSVALKELPVNLETRRRYKVGTNALAKWLIEREYCVTNPVRDVDLGRTRMPRPVIHLKPDEARKLVEAIPNPKYQAMEALMAGTGMELQSVRAVEPRNVDFDKRLVLAQGQKNRYRTRWVEVSEDWAWEIFKRYVQVFEPTARPFGSLGHHSFLDVHHEVAKKLRLRPTTPHHHRHSFALKWLAHALSNVDDRDVPWLKNQLGHAPQSTVLFTTYAVEIKAMRLTTAQEKRLSAVPEKRAAGVSKR